MKTINPNILIFICSSILGILFFIVFTSLPFGKDDKSSEEASITSASEAIQEVKQDFEGDIESIEETQEQDEEDISLDSMEIEEEHIEKIVDYGYTIDSQKPKEIEKEPVDEKDSSDTESVTATGALDETENQSDKIKEALLGEKTDIYSDEVTIEKETKESKKTIDMTYKLLSFNISGSDKKIYSFEGSFADGSDVESVEVLSCKENDSTEYDESWYRLKDYQSGDDKFKYNISELYNNKCDIAYKFKLIMSDKTEIIKEYNLSL